MSRFPFGLHVSIFEIPLQSLVNLTLMISQVVFFVNCALRLLNGIYLIYKFSCILCGTLQYFKEYFQINFMNYRNTFG